MFRGWSQVGRGEPGISDAGFNAAVKAVIGLRQRSHRDAELRRWIGRQIVEMRTEAEVSQPALAACARISQGYLWKIEAGLARPSLDTLQSISACLGCDLSVRFYPGSGARLHDRFQAPMFEALIRTTGREWRVQPEVGVPAARGVIDLVLSRPADHVTIVCECHSELRRLEIVLRRAFEKTEALRGQLEVAGTVSTLLLLRSTVATRAIARAYEATLAAAFPARSADAIAAMRFDTAWPGAALVWAKLEGGRAEILEAPPRGIRLGR
jgi:transcriptional regulator with XRE-family HTH domain